ncbi:amidohydrolase family protein [Acidiphilium sp. AL]|uniref:Amidohydrolase family protein n=1 Tax=Acidiphilium iwatense TaxID=768198 RepID=A0ABS9DZH9_9PROT|nr:MULTISPECIES: amidohydrolase family protein [Acidiphilium]MCF3948099.1 amidohydrolase family protein [Acidiphilium iwatense]MCU4161868.1 amidohydrolase family protein [Acidiphilium sp. AL]
MSFDLVIHNATLPDGRRGMDIGINDGKIAAIEPSLPVVAARIIDAAGNLVAPPFVDSHLHLDSALSLGQPRLNESGTLLEGIALWGELKPHLTVEAIHARARRLCLWSIAQGIGAVRSHVDICDDRLIAVEALTALREEMAPYLTIQLVAFPQDGFLRYSKARENLLRALDKGVDIVGGIPHFERTMADGAESVRQLMAIAAERGLAVDMHCDETDDPHSRHIETLAAETARHGMHGRVTGSHLTSLHSMDNYYASKLIPLIAEAGISAIPNPLINITLQGRHDTYPKRRGMTRVPELMAAGVNVAFGHDCVMDPWYPLGSHDMLEVAAMGLHVAQMTGLAGMRTCFDAVTTNAARAMGLADYGVSVGCRADLVVLDAADPIEAIRTRATRRYVLRGGTVIAETPPRRSRVIFENDIVEVDLRLPH